MRRLNVELLEQNKELKDSLEANLACEECEIWKEKTEKLASKYFETISGMKNEIKALKRESTTMITNAKKDIKEKLSTQLKMSLLKINRRDDVLRDELHAVRVERSRSGSTCDRSLRNRPPLSDDQILPYLGGSVKQSITSNSQTAANTISPTINIDAYNEARQKLKDPESNRERKNDESLYIETSRQEFSYEKLDSGRDPLTDQPQREDIISGQMNLANLAPFSE